MDVSTRHLRAFVVLAEELHFTRAAGRLFIAQQALSRQIRDLEASVGAQLVERTTRNVALTAAGEAFLEAARTALGAFDAGVERAARLSRGQVGLLRIGYQSGAVLELTAPLLDAVGATHPEVALEVREFGFDDPSAGLLSGWADVAIVRPPFSGEGVCLEPVLSEPLCVAVRASHPLAALPAVTLPDVLAEPIVVGGNADPVWTGFWTLEALRGGVPATVAVHTASHTEEVSAVAAGAGIMVTVAAAARFTPHPGVAYLPVAGLPRSVIAVGWRAGHDGPLVRSFLALVRRTKEAEPEIVATIERGGAPG